MTALSALQFEFEGQPVRIAVQAADPTQSPFTGRTLRRESTSIQVVPHEVDLVKRLLDASPVSDSEGTLWNGHLDVESFQQGGPHTLEITWNEVEALQADAVEFQGLSLRPTKYEEHDNDDTIAISFKAVLSAEETEVLRALMEPNRSGAIYWPVVRRGVSDDSRSMRLGRVLWQPLTDGSIAHDITLVDEAFDASDEPNHFLTMHGEPEVSNLVGAVAGLLGQIGVLIAELEAANALPSESIERIRAAANEMKPANRHLFFEVADISKW